MSFSLEMLTKAADLVETQEKQKRLMESPSPSAENRKSSNHVGDTKSREVECNGSREKTTNGTGENHRQEHPLPNGRVHDNIRHSPGVNLSKTVNNHDRRASEDELRNRLENSLQHRVVTDPSNLPESVQYQLHQQRVAAERSNGIEHQQRGDIKPRVSDERSRTLPTPERYHPAERRSTSPATDRGGVTNSTTKPMVLLQPPTAATLSSVGSGHPAQLSNPALQAAAATMHHQYLYQMMYPTGAPLDPALGAFARVPGAGIKEEGQTSSPNASPTANLSAATAAGMHFPAGLMYPLANQALLMGARAPGGISDISPLLLAQPSATYPGAAGVAPNFLMEYKRYLEAQFPAAYSIQPQLNDQYIRAIMGQGIDGSKDTLTMSGMAGRLPPGIPLAALQNQPGAASELLMRYPEQLNAAMGLLRPQDGISPRAGSPYANKRRTESPVLPNGSKIATSSYPYHLSSLGQPGINNLSAARPHVRSPAAPMFSQGHRSRSPHMETRKPEPERSSYRAHSRDLDREGKLIVKDLASTSASTNHNRNSEHVAHSYSVTDEAGRKIQLPAFYSGSGSVHAPHGYHGGPPVHHPGHERSPSPHSRVSEDRSYHRQSRERSPGGDHLPNKRRSLDTQYRHSPALNDRHNSRPTSPTTNGQIPAGRHLLVNGSAEAASELAKVNPHLLLSMTHARSPNQVGLAEGREQRSSTPPTTNPYVPPYLAPQLLGGLTGAVGPQLILPQYAQALAKGADLSSLYKAGENGTDYSRLAAAGLPFGMAFLPPQQQQQLLAAGRSSHVLSQEYAAALKAQSYLASQAGGKESGKASPANLRDKHPGLTQPIHPSLLAPQPPQALSPGKQGLKPKHSPSPQFAKSAHLPHITDSHSPPSGLGSSGGAMSATDGRRYMSPRPERRDPSPKPVASNKPYRPDSMLRQHAEDMERSRKRKLLEEEIAMGEEASNFRQGKKQQLLQQRTDQREQLAKDAKKDPKRRKQLLAESDQDIEDHFRRSLGKDYNKDTSNKVSITGSVDDHFIKALGMGVWDRLQTPAPTTPIKGEPRETAVPHPSHALPSYSVAVAAGTARGYPAFLANRERYHIQSMAAQHQQRRTEKSPPPRAPGSTVLYPTPNPPTVGPAKQRVKAKAVFPEAASLGSDLNNRSARATSLGSKGSSRSVSGSSAESLPAALSKSPPTSSPRSSSTVEGIPRVPAPVTLPTAIPYTYAHPAGLPTTSNPAVSHPQPPVISVSGATQHQKPSSPASPRVPGPEEHSRSPPTQSFITTSDVGTKESVERQPVENGKPST